MTRRLAAWMLAAGLAVLGAPAMAQASDPVVQFSTTLGNIDVRLLQEDAPKTVQNFLDYVDSGAYNGTVFHRSVQQAGSSPLHIIQGGGFKVTPATSPNYYAFQVNGFTEITQLPAVANEFKESNTAGTLAMALTSSTNSSGTSTTNENSATDQWFFNVQDNSAALDPQDFTVFGDVVGDGMNVVNAIAALPTDDFETEFEGVDPTIAGNFEDVPVQNYTEGSAANPNPLEPGNLIYVNSITVLPSKPPTVTITKPTKDQEFTLNQVVKPSYSCDDKGGTGIASCTGAATLATSLYGTFTYAVTATDNSGDTVTKSVTYWVVPSIPSSHHSSSSPAPSLLSVSTVSRAGSVSLTLRCKAKSRCAGRLTLYSGSGRKRKAIGSARYSIAAGHTSKLAIKLSSAGRKLLRHGKGRLRVTALFAPSGKGARTSSRSLTLRAK